jgi:hypothetical protein
MRGPTPPWRSEMPLHIDPSNDDELDELSEALEDSLYG